jgi:hypothetical protein
MKHPTTKILFILSFIGFLLFFFSCNEKPHTVHSNEILQIQCRIDTSNYQTTVIESVNPEQSDVIFVQYNLKLDNYSKLYDTTSITLSNMIIIVNPYDNTACSVDFPGNQNGLYDENGQKLNFPITITPYGSLSCILKHGQTIDKTTLEFLKNHFEDISQLNAKKVFVALINNGLNLQNDRTLRGEEFQLRFNTSKQNQIIRDLSFPYNNYCK